MAIPSWDDFDRPILQLAADGQPHRVRDLVDPVGEKLAVPEEERKELLSSGQQTRLANRVYWACSYLKRAGILHAPRRGYIQLTDEGHRVLKNGPENISRAWLLANYQGVRDFVSPSGTAPEPHGHDLPDNTPEETLESAYQQLRRGLAAELLDQVKQQPPDFFERLVVELLVKMGYGGSLRDAGEAVGKSGDGGIDGIIKEDRLGLDLIYIQAKRYDYQSIGRPLVQGFVGALQGVRACKGIFLTTSTFTADAKQYAQILDTKVILVDGEQLAEYMIDFGVGVTTASTFEVKRIDSDYFNDD
jgi:restriction system protein